ncbi:flagellar protein FlgN [Peribacillus frigoritolerans]|nr:flagellar protein FlgN [Peribacillus frigoritolerans]
MDGASFRPSFMSGGGSEMTARNIIGSLEKLIKLHKSFNQLAIRKTAILKANDTEAITALLISEQKHIKAIGQTDKEKRKGSRGISCSQWNGGTACLHPYRDGTDRTRRNGSP